MVEGVYTRGKSCCNRTQLEQLTWGNASGAGTEPKERGNILHFIDFVDRLKWGALQAKGSPLHFHPVCLCSAVDNEQPLQELQDRINAWVHVCSGKVGKKGISNFRRCYTLTFCGWHESRRVSYASSVNTPIVLTTCITLMPTRM